VEEVSTRQAYVPATLKLGAKEPGVVAPVAEEELVFDSRGILYLWSITVTFLKMVTRQTAYTNNFVLNQL
jgi:hypothetical protein